MWLLLATIEAEMRIGLCRDNDSLYRSTDVDDLLPLFSNLGTLLLRNSTVRDEAFAQTASYFPDGWMDGSIDRSFYLILDEPKLRGRGEKRADHGTKLIRRLLQVT